MWGERLYVVAAALRERKQGKVVTMRPNWAARHRLGNKHADTSGCCLLKTTIIQKGYAFVFLSAVYEWLLATTFDQTGASGGRRSNFLRPIPQQSNASGQ